MLYPNFKVSLELSFFTLIRHVPWNTFFALQLNVFISLLWLFDAIWIYIKNQNLKNEEKRTISILSWTGNILCGMKSLFLFLCGAFLCVKVTHQKVYFSINKVNIRAFAKVLILTTGIFPAWSLNNFFNFYKPECFIPGVL